MSHAIDLTGQKFGRLQVIKRGKTTPGSNGNVRYWWCQCDCGSEAKEIRGDNLRSGRSQSCGCLQREKAKSKAYDLTGNVVGKLTVVEQGPSRTTGSGGAQWWVKCSCGSDKYLVRASELKNENVRSCGCDRLYQDLTGLVVGKLTVLEESRYEKITYANYSNHKRWWLCKCECGNFTEVLGHSLANNVTSSCGCSQKEAVTTHGMSSTKIYSVWRGMLERCGNEKATSYKRYGAKGITVCDRWLEFENFYADMGDVPEGKTIDRYPNKTGNYEPGNCRWATPKEQSNNVTTNRNVSYKDREYTLAELVDLSPIGINYETARHRLNRGWTPEEVISVPLGVSIKTYREELRLTVHTPVES